MIFTTLHCLVGCGSPPISVEAPADTDGVSDGVAVEVQEVAETAGDDLAADSVTAEVANQTVSVTEAAEEDKEAARAARANSVAATDAAVEPSKKEDESNEEVASEPRGLRINKPGVTPGYVLFTPLLSDTTYLIDTSGLVVHTWKSDFAPSSAVYLLDNGNLLRGAREPEVAVFHGGGQGGRLQEFTWEGELVWDFLFANEQHLTHHDVEPLPNGNLLAIAWEQKTAEETRRAGRLPERISEKGLWPGMVLEFERQPPSGARIVWQWHVWDHLIQDHDPSAANYGDPAKSPWRININGDREPMKMDPRQLKRLQALGYIPRNARPEDLGSDMLHTNAIAYNPELDQIVLSVPRFNEIWIIDHSTTQEEAAGSSGGRWGRGGDLLYRWGNPRAYGRGDKSQQSLFSQHDVRWIPANLPGAGNVTVFNNGLKGPEGDYSAVIELAPPVDSEGRYQLPESEPFGPSELVWSYEAPDKVSFHSGFISSAQRLASGSTLICSGAQGRFFEVTPDGEIVWEYWDPHSGNVRLPDGSPPHPVGKSTYAVFRATKIAPDHPALVGRDLRPLDPQPPIALVSDEGS